MIRVTVLCGVVTALLALACAAPSPPTLEECDEACGTKYWRFIEDNCKNQFPTELHGCGTNDRGGKGPSDKKVEAGGPEASVDVTEAPSDEEEEAGGPEASVDVTEAPSDEEEEAGGPEASVDVTEAPSDEDGEAGGPEASVEVTEAPSDEEEEAGGPEASVDVTEAPSDKEEETGGPEASVDVTEEATTEEERTAGMSTTLTPAQKADDAADEAPSVGDKNPKPQTDEMLSSSTTRASLLVPSEAEEFSFEDDDQVPQESGTSPLLWFLFLIGVCALAYVFRKPIMKQLGGGTPATRGRYQRVGALGHGQ